MDVGKKKPEWIELCSPSLFTFAVARDWKNARLADGSDSIEQGSSSSSKQGQLH